MKIEQSPESSFYSFQHPCVWLARAYPILQQNYFLHSALFEEPERGGFGKSKTRSVQGVTSLMRVCTCQRIPFFTHVYLTELPTIIKSKQWPPVDF